MVLPELLPSSEAAAVAGQKGYAGITCCAGTLHSEHSADGAGVVSLLVVRGAWEGFAALN